MGDRREENENRLVVVPCIFEIREKCAFGAFLKSTEKEKVCIPCIFEIRKNPALRTLNIASGTLNRSGRPASTSPLSQKKEIHSTEVPRPHLHYPKRRKSTQQLIESLQTNPPGPFLPFLAPSRRWSSGTSRSGRASPPRSPSSIRGCRGSEKPRKTSFPTAGRT